MWQPKSGYNPDFEAAPTKASRVKIAGYPAGRTLSLTADRVAQVPPFPAIDPRRGVPHRHLNCLIKPYLAGMTHCLRSWLQGPQCSTVVTQLFSPSCHGQLPRHLASTDQLSDIYQLLGGRDSPSQSVQGIFSNHQY